MRLIIAWIIFFIEITRYLLSKVRLSKKPDVRVHVAYWDVWLSSVFGWRKGLRLRNGEKCPRKNPVIFAGNHAKLEDPFCLWCSVHRVSEGKIHPYFMMRDDYFEGKPWSLLPFKINDVLQMGGGYGVTRDRIQLSQLRVFMDMLKAPGSFIMFPGRSRSRSGLVMEYRDGIDEPGAVSFFMAHTHRHLKETPVAAVPMMRTFNPLDKSCVVIFGDPLYLDPDLGREQQRELDFDLVAAIGALVEVHALHLVSVLLYLRALHQLGDTWTEDSCVEAVRSILAKVQDRYYLHPALWQDTAGEVRQALRFLAKLDKVQLQGEGTLRVDRNHILRTPALETRFRKENPAQHCANQILHLTGLIRVIESIALPGTDEDALDTHQNQVDVV